eukprot:Colp12_sorted_trinity150504_noHs@28550
MTTAGRPTWSAAQGGPTTRDSAPTRQYSSRDLPGHTKIKIRQKGQDTYDDLRERDLKQELLERERDHYKQKRKKDYDEEEDEEYEKRETKQLRIVDEHTAKIDADDPVESEEEEEEEDEDEDDDEDELLKELEKIKRERAEEAEREAQRQAEDEQQIRTEAALRGNPLLNQADDFSVKRRWDDDVVFKNCAKGIEERKEKRFINDTLRSDFHRRFMTKYIS